MTAEERTPIEARPLILYLDEYSDRDIARLTDMLPAWRRSQALRFRHQAGLRQCVLAYVALCQALRDTYGIAGQPDFDYNAHGKPSLRQFPAIHFSLSHCRQAVGCLVADRPCGLDLEAPRPVRESLVRYTMNEDEARQVFSAANPDEAFLRLWTQKEAVLKLRGTGINGSMKDVLAPEGLRDIDLHTEQDPARKLIWSWAIGKKRPSAQKTLPKKTLPQPLPCREGRGVLGALRFRNNEITKFRKYDIPKFRYSDPSDPSDPEL